MPKYTVKAYHTTVRIHNDVEAENEDEAVTSIGWDREPDEEETSKKPDTVEVEEEDEGHQLFAYHAIHLDEITATDLREEAQAHPGGMAYIVTLIKPDGYRDKNTEKPEVLFYHGLGRMGIAWGADATWADVDSVEQGIDVYLNDGERWRACN